MLSLSIKFRNEKVDKKYNNNNDATMAMPTTETVREHKMNR